MLLTPAGKRLTKASKDEEVVKDWLNEKRLLVGRGQHVEPSALTLHDWLITWVETYSRPNVRQRTYERNKSLITHIEDIGYIPIQKVTPVHLQTLYNNMEEEGFASETRKKVHNLIHGALKQAVLNKFLQINPTDLVTPPKVTRDEIQIFTSLEIDLILNTAKRFRLYPTILLAITTGMRLGESTRLSLADIDLQNGVLRVYQNLQMSDEKGIIFEPPKTEKRKRKIPLPPQTIAALKEYRKTWNESRLKHPDNDDLAFVSITHTPLHPKNFTTRTWNRIQIDAEFAQNKFDGNPQKTKKKLEVMLEECRQKKDWQPFLSRNFHAIRHTYATTLLASGVPIVDVSRVLGHAKVSTTLDIYGHAIPENSKIIADKLQMRF